MSNWRLIYEDGAELHLTDDDVRRIIAFLNDEDTALPAPADQSTALLAALSAHQANPEKMSRAWWDDLSRYVTQNEG